jgi:GNAT superfamily N-acetyltransferase
MNNFKTETNELKDIKNALVEINSFEELAKSPRRKSFLIAIDNVGKNKTTPKGSLKELLGSFNVFIDYNELRDGFYRENDFTQNDIMLVGKPTGLGGSAPHSTYETAILGEVVGVPDTKIDSWNIMPQALRDKYQSVIGGRETKTKAMQAKVIAAETGVVRGLEAQPIEVKAKANKAESFFNDADVLFPNDDIRGGYAVTDKGGKQIGRIKMSEVNDNTVKIDEVISEKRGQRTGNGSAIMKMVIDNADKNNVTLTLTPNLIGEMKAKGFETAEKLRSFYTKFGFVKDKGKATMTREPNVSEVKLEAQPIELFEETEVPISKSQIVGERAILSATADFNKNLAITMFESKSSPLDIRIATGWEKGADGEWRYEIPDGKYKDIDIDDLQKEMDYDGKTVRIAKLSDVFAAPDLFEAYPEAKDIKVGFKNLTAKKGYKLYGSYVKDLNRINVNENIYKENRYEAELTMLHEIQHYIQDIEFFEKGTNDSKTIDAIKKAENDFKNKLDAQKKVYQDLKKSSPDSKEAIKDALELYNIIKYGYQEIKYLGKFKLNKKEKITVLNAIEDVNKFRKENSMPLITLKDALKSKVRKDAYNIYLRVAGEVEARNVPKRNKLTPEEKRRTLLSETEDFYREDQVLLKNKNFYLTKEYREMDKEFPISKSQVEVYHGTPHNVDKFSTSKIGTGEGNQAFGWGLYFTTLKSIAQHYANVLSGANNITVDGIGLKELLKKKGLEKNYKNATEDGNPNLNIWIKALTDVVADARTKSDALQNINEKIKEVEDNIEYANQKIKDKEFLADADIKMTESSLRGLNRMLQDYNFLYDSIRDVEDYKADTNKNVYEVSLHEGKKPSEYTWLEWDKKIKKDVRDRILERFTQEGYISKKDLNKLIEDGIQYLDVEDAFDIFDDMGLPISKGMTITALLDDERGVNGLVIYDRLRNVFESDQQKTSEFLLRAKVDGVKYPAESVSRGATSEDARGFNYVVFDENAVTIKAVSKSQVDATNVVNKIVKDARAQGFSEESIRLFLESKGLDANDIKTAMQPEIPASKKATVTETMLAGFNTLMTKIGALINKSASDKNVIGFLKNDKAYTNATDIQKEDMVRQVRAKLGLKQKSAPTADRLLGAIKNLAKITMTEKQALVKQIKDLSRGGKDAKKAIAEASKQLSKEVKTLVTEGKLTVNQAANVLRAFSKVNVLSQTSVDRFTEYMTKVFANAEYASKLITAKSLRRDISKLSKNKDKNANLRDLAQQFAKINPSMVEDIDAYNDMASKIKEATKGSTIRLEKVTFAETVNIENASKYIDETIKAQDEMIRQERIAEIQDLMGIDASDFSAEDMLALLEGEKEVTKYNESIARDAINKMFNIYSALINDAIRAGRDTFTNEEVDFTDSQKDVVKRFMDMDLNLLGPKEAIQAVDALANFLQNSSTARMESVLSKYTGNLYSQELADKGVVAFPLRKYGLNFLGRFLGEQTTNLNILFEKLFKGFNKGALVMSKMGLTKLINGKSAAKTKANNIVDKYVAQFYKKQANGEAYNTKYNNVERGLAAFMMRNVIGTEAEMKTEFNRRRKLIKQSIKVLSEGNDKEKIYAELYQKVYDKILKDSESIQEVKDKTDPTNLEGIEYWMNEWADKYEQLSDVALNVYNKVLNKDLNYTPDRYLNLESEEGSVELGNDDSAFFNNSDGIIYKKETGSLMTVSYPEFLPKDKESGRVTSYIDLSFDKNNSN